MQKPQVSPKKDILREPGTGVILVTPEAEIRRTEVQNQPEQIVQETLS
jgi:hypothetical protein